MATWMSSSWGSMTKGSADVYPYAPLVLRAGAQCSKPPAVGGHAAIEGRQSLPRLARIHWPQCMHRLAQGVLFRGWQSDERVVVSVWHGGPGAVVCGEAIS